MEGRDEGAFEDGGGRAEEWEDCGREEGDGECVEDDRERERKERQRRRWGDCACA